MNREQTVRLIFGDDEFRVARACRETLAAWVPADQTALALECVDGAAETCEEACRVLDLCREALLTPAFMGAVKTVWLRDAAFLGSAALTGAPPLKERLRGLAAWIAGAGGGRKDVRLLVSAPKLDKRTGLFLACKKAADIQEFSVPEKSRQAGQYARERLTELLEEQGLRAAPPVLDAIVERVGVDTRGLAAEAVKLKAGLGGRKTVRPEDVGELVSASRQFMVWEFTDAVGNRNLTAALRAMRRLLSQKDAPLLLLAALDGFVRDLILYRHAIDCRWLRSADSRGATLVWNDVPPDVEELLGKIMDRDPRKTHPFRIGSLARIADGTDMRQLAEWRAAIMRTYGRMFSGSVAPKDHLELLLLRMLGKKSRKIQGKRI